MRVRVCKAVQNGFSGSSIIGSPDLFSESEVRSSSSSDSLLSSLVASKRLPCGFVPLGQSKNVERNKLRKTYLSNRFFFASEIFCEQGVIMLSVGETNFGLLEMPSMS